MDTAQVPALNSGDLQCAPAADTPPACLPPPTNIKGHQKFWEFAYCAQRAVGKFQNPQN